MGLTLQLAWRNVWRNPRRTVLTLVATVFAVFLVVFFVAMATGLHEKMIEDGARIHSGHLSISGAGYLENRTLEQFVRLGPDLERLLEETPEVEGYAPRVVGFGLLSHGSATQGVGVLGVEPGRESTVSTFPDRVREGRFLESGGEREVVLGSRLARKLSATLGDSLLLYSVAYSQETAIDLFSVVGLMKLPDPRMDRTLAVVSLAAAQDFYAYGDRLSEVAILARDADAAVGLAVRLRAALPATQGDAPEIHTWQELMPELVQFIFLDDAGMYMMLVILVIVVGFGILNTILMSVLERTRELGVVLALGLRPQAVFRLVYLESMLLAALGLLLGLSLAVPAVLWFQAHPVPLGGALTGAMELFGFEPVVTWKLESTNLIGSSLTILAVAFVAAFYPALKASRSRPVEALRDV